MNHIDLSKQTILVTGAGGNGVGAGICKVLSECGAKLIINDSCNDKVDAAVALYPGAVGFVADISAYRSVEALFNHIKDQIGPIDGLVNNAGVGLNKSAHLAQIEEFDQLYAVDVRGLWMMSKAFIAQLLHYDIPGNIVNISSVHAHSTTAGYAIYASAKAAVETLTKGMAIEVGKDQIRVNSIAPGYVHAEQNFELIAKWTDEPSQWVAQHNVNQQALNHQISNIDVGNSTAFLLSSLSRSITGQTLRVDNGMTAMLYNNDIFNHTNKPNSFGVNT